MGIIIFNGVSSKNLFKIWSPPDYIAPTREYESIAVPGRNGAILIDKNSFQNVTRSYTISFGDEKRAIYPQRCTEIMQWLNSASSYAELWDSYEEDYIRLAVHHASPTFANLLMQAGTATLEFDCKPQRYLKSAYDNPTKITTAINKGSERTIELDNPTIFASKPKIIIRGESNATAHDMFTNDIKIVITDESGLSYEIYLDTYKIRKAQHSGISPLPNDFEVVLDSDIQNSYAVQTVQGVSSYRNANSGIRFVYGYPELFAGINNATFSVLQSSTASTLKINSIDIYTRWWTI